MHPPTALGSAPLRDSGCDHFRAISNGSADIVTDQIDRITPDGVELTSGEKLAADIIITATGLNSLVIGGMSVTVDGRPIPISDTLAYKGMMLSGVPNFSLTIGYTNASWTLKADLVARYVCRILKHMDSTGMQIVTPEAPQLIESVKLVSLIDLDAGYILRSAGGLPKQGERSAWKLHQN
ncbi:MAG: NAD(P)/FAD-dependent oxidoreductase [Salinibacterium sp.]|nr:NAD(P)/FAD-dependent oxidoreductase [Salinibacterium sp.]